MSSISPVMIGRMVLSLIGANTNVESFLEESSEARQLKLWYDLARTRALAAFDWGFARKTVSLAVHAEDPVDGWQFRYTSPVDMVAGRRLINPLGKDEDTPPHNFALSSSGEKTILADVEQAKFAYTADVTDPNLFSPQFIEALVYLWASMVVANLKGDSGRVMQLDLRNQYNILINRAGSEDGNSEIPLPERDATWIEKR